MKTLFLFLLVSTSHAAEIPGFQATVECDARSLHGGHPKDATSIQLGYWKESGEKTFYVLSGDKLRVGLRAETVRPDAGGRLETAVLAEDLDSGQWMHYGTVRLQAGGAGVLDSDWDKNEPYVLGSLELSNCRTY